MVLAVALLIAGTVAQAATEPATPGVGVTTKVRSEGCAEGTTLASRDAAVLDARRNAVSLWLELELGQATGDEFSAVFEYIDRYTASFRLIGVHSDEGRTCVELDVYLYEWPLRADTAAVLFGLRTTPPKIAFLFVEEDTSTGTRKFQAGTRISKLFTDLFTEKGFTIVGGTSGGPVYSERELLSIAGGGDAALARYGAELGADAVVAVEAALSAAPEPQSTGGLRAKAVVTARAVSTSTGRLHEKTRDHAEIDCADAESGFGFALPDAVYKVRDQAVVGAILAARIEPGTTATAGVGDHISLNLEGVGDFQVAQRFAEYLRTLAGVSEAAVISVRAGNALLSFTYEGRMAGLVDVLEAGEDGLPKLSARKVAGSEMVFRTLPAAQPLPPFP